MPTGDVVVQVFGKTDVGRTREHNEDAFVVADLTTGNATLQPEVRRHVLGPRGTMFMVADGMGGAAAGEIASAMATDVVLREMRAEWSASAAQDPEAFARAIRRATATANAEIHDYAARHPEFRGMGTTATVAGLLGDTLYLAQVGDSRAYIVRAGVARQITKDQSLMQKLVEAGELTEEEAEHSERRNIILQALGPDAQVKVDLTHQAVRRGDVLVLCSDGLSGQVTRDEIGAIVTQEPDLVQVCRRLIDRANETGGPDNITVIVARFDGTALQDPALADGVGHAVFPLADTGQTPAMRDGESARATLAQERPTLPIEVESLGALPTEPVPVMTPTLATEPIALPSATGEHPSVAPAPPERRRQGMFVAAALFILLLALGAWYVFQAASRVAPRPRPAAPAATTPA